MDKTPLETMERVLIVGAHRYKWTPSSRFHVHLECANVKIDGTAYDLCIQVTRDRREKEWRRVHGAAETQNTLMLTGTANAVKLTEMLPKHKERVKAVLDEVVSAWRIYNTMNDVYRLMLVNRIRYLRDKEQTTADGFRLMAEQADKRVATLTEMMDAEDAETQLEEWYRKAQGGIMSYFD